MANVSVKNSTTGAMGNQAARRTRYEKMETAFGKIPAAAWADGDVLVFDQLPMKELIHAQFVVGEGTNTEAEVFYGADISSPIYYNIGALSATTDISYVISYIKGTGKIDDSTATAGEGKLLKLQVYLDE